MKKACGQCPMVNGKVTYIDGIGRLLQFAQHKHKRGELKGVVIGMVHHDGSFVTGWSNTLTYIERLGLLEAAKQDCFYKAVIEEGS